MESNEIKQLEDKILFLEKVLTVLVAKHRITNIPIELIDNDTSIAISKNKNTASIFVVDNERTVINI